MTNNTYKNIPFMSVTYRQTSLTEAMEIKLLWIQVHADDAI